MKLEVGRYGIGVNVYGIFEGAQRCFQRQQVFRGSPRSSEACSFSFQADAQFEDRDHVIHSCKVFCCDLEVASVMGLQNKRAYSMPGFDKAGCLQLGQRLAYHGAADVKPGHDFGLSRQFFTRQQTAFADAADKAVDDLANQPPGPANTRQPSIAHPGGQGGFRVTRGFP